MRDNPGISPARLLNQLHRLWITFRQSANVDFHRDQYDSEEYQENSEEDSDEESSIDYPENPDDTIVRDLEIVFDDWDLDEDASDAATAA